MGRGYGRRRVERQLAGIRAALPDAALRTTFIVGHPGERESDFRELLEFVREGHFDHMGVFIWSPEPGTASEQMKHRVAFRTAEERRDRLMREQARVSARRHRARRGRATTVLLERLEADGWHGRTPWQAPEVDGDTRLENAGARARSGDFVPAVITGTRAYDFRARRAEA